MALERVHCRKSSYAWKIESCSQIVLEGCDDKELACVENLRRWWAENPEGKEVGRTVGDVQCREHLGGLLRYYYRQAA